MVNTELTKKALSEFRLHDIYFASTSFDYYAEAILVIFPYMVLLCIWYWLIIQITTNT